MSKKMYRVITEWDMGMELNIYKSIEDAWRDLRRVHDSMVTQVQISPDFDFEYCRESGLYSVEELELVEFDNELSLYRGSSGV